MTDLEEQRKNEQMREMITKMGLDYDRIRKQYKSGYGLEKIAEMHRINIEQLKWVLDNIIKVSRSEWTIRNENRKKFASIQIPFELPNNRRTYLSRSRNA